MPLHGPPPHRSTTPGGNREHAVLALSTRGRRGGPFGGPVTPSRHGLRSRRPAAGARGCILVFLITASGLLALVAGSARASPSARTDGISDLTLSVTLSFYNATENRTTAVGQTEGAVLFLGDEPQLYDNFTLVNGTNYTSSGFPGLNLTNLTTVLVDVYSPVGCGCADAQAEYDNLSGDPTLPLNVVFQQNSTAVGLPPPPPPGSDTAAPFPAFLRLVGVGVAIALTFLVIQGLRRLLVPLASEN